jgi:hypothetical protein
MKTNKLINKVLNSSIEGYTCYLYRNSHWIINSSTNDWVVQVSNSGYTFYRQEFFKKICYYLSLSPGDIESYVRDWVVNELGFYVSDHCHPDYMGGEYDWRKDFDAMEVVDYGVVSHIPRQME